MPTINRVVLIVMDGVGIGELPDAYKWGDEGSNTLANVASAVGGLSLPNFQQLGLGNIFPIKGIAKVTASDAVYGKMAEQSAGKDSTVGHWEISGIITDKAFPTYPHGFPPEIIQEFELRTGKKTIGNIAISGTEVIERFGEIHMQTGQLIVYTSADSVFQIAAHNDIVPLNELYRYCEIARQILKGDDAVSRVIARPFVGHPGAFQRTPDRKDFSLAPPRETLLDKIIANGKQVITIGKVDYLFSGRGVSKAVHVLDNLDGINKTIDSLNSEFSGLIFVNLGDFDVKYGHRNNPEGFAASLVELDNHLPMILNALRDDDILIITGDHGNDPTTISTDHSREFVPLIIYGHSIQKNISLGTLNTFADLGAMISDSLLGFSFGDGKSFYHRIRL
jgi:phosphopentomutase